MNNKNTRPNNASREELQTKNNEFTGLIAYGEQYNTYNKKDNLEELNQHQGEKGQKFVANQDPHCKQSTQISSL